MGSGLTNSRLHIFFIFAQRGLFLKMTGDYIEKDHKVIKSVATPFFQEQLIKTHENDNGLF